jgi:hypothetical protein
LPGVVQAPGPQESNGVMDVRWCPTDPVAESRTVLQSNFQQSMMNGEGGRASHLSAKLHKFGLAQGGALRRYRRQTSVVTCFRMSARKYAISSLSNVNNITRKSMAEHTVGIFGVPKTQTGVKMTQYKQKITVFNKRKAPVGGSFSRLPKPVLKWKNRSFFGDTISRPTTKTEENYMKLCWRPRDEISRSRIKQISLPVAQIREMMQKWTTSKYR